MASDDFNEGFDLKKMLKVFKIVKWQYLVLAAIIILGIFLRSYHINYPTIGYHNMKEDHYLSLALNMRESGNLLRTTWYDCSGNLINDYFGNPYDGCSGNWGEHPVAVWTLMMFLGISGWEIWSARLMIILFSVLSVIPIYLIIKRLSNNEYISILSAFVYSVLPLSIFVGRNIQMDAPSYFFSLVTLYFMIKFIDHNKTKDVIIAAVFFTLAAWFKPLSLFVLFGLLFIIPLSKYKHYFTHIKEYKIEIFALLLAVVLYALWPMLISGIVMPAAKEAGQAGITSDWLGKNSWVDTSFSIFTSEYWKNNKMMIFSYISDNYSWTGFWLAMLGFLLFALKYKSRISKFMFGYALGIIIYITLFAFKWNAHMYYQFPFLMFAAAGIANVFFQAGMILKSLLSNETARKIIQFLPLLALLLLIAPFKESTERMFNTQFFGSDVAGTYLNQNTMQGEIFLLERGIQSEVSWTARRFYYSVPDDVEIIKRLEKEKQLTYIAATYSGVATIQQKKSWQYITENYHIAQIGFVQAQDGPQVYHMVLKKGGTFNMTTLENKPARLATTYEYTNGMQIPYYVIEI